MPATAGQLEDKAQYQDWQVKCGRTPQQAKSCFLVQTVSNKTNKQPILQAMVGFLPEHKEPSAIFTIANLLPIETKLKLIFSNTFAISFKLKSCRKENLVCIATLKIDKKLQQQITKGEVAYLSFPFAGKQRQIPISLLGLGLGLEVLTK